MKIFTTITRVTLLSILCFFCNYISAQNSYPSSGMVTVDGVTSRNDLFFWYGKNIKAGGVLYGNILHSNWSSGIGDYVDFYTAGNSTDDIAEKLRIIQNGNVGIGVKIPAQRLHVQGSGMFTGDLLIGWGKEIKTHGMSYNSIIKTGWETGKDYTSFYVPGNSTDDATEKMRINQLGQIGIGTTYIPSEYLLAVNGKTITTEVNVRLRANWPDYVFQKTYNLRPLSQVESFIKENKHLPEIPSAKEVEANGINLGEMDALLLKKIEELTLYTIEISKKMGEMDKQLLHLQKENSMLRLNLETR